MSKQYPGGLITKTPVTPSGPYETSTASGVWTINQAAYWKKQGLWPTSGNIAPDPYFNYVTMLLHGDGSASGTTSVLPFNSDASTNNFNITINGDARSNNFNPYQSGYYSNYFDGSGDYLTTPSAASISNFSGDFTIEGWVYLNATTAYGVLIGGNGSSGWYVEYGSARGFGAYDGSTFLNGSSTAVTNQWVNFAVTRASGTVRFFINGALTASASSANFNVTQSLGIAAYSGGSSSLNGFLSNIRINNTTALYTSAFTPSTTPLTAIAGTSLLTCQSNRFIDNSTNAFTITKNGSTSIAPTQPFTLPSSVATYGSGYFDGTGDSLTINGGTGVSAAADFTYEVWIYPTTVSPTYQQIAHGTSLNGAYGFQLLLNGSALYLWNSLSHQTAVLPNQWSHVALVRSSNTVRLYLNGVQSTNSITTSSTATIITIGTNGSGGTENFNGYQSDSRLVSGTAIYTATFTPPTSPLTAVSGTSLLTQQYNGAGNNNGFKDSGQFNFPITRNGNTTQGTFTPYGSNWSNYFGGSGNSLNYPSASQYAIGTGNFTVEFFVNFASLNAGHNRMFCIGASGTDGLELDLNGTNLEVGIQNGYPIGYTWTPTAGTWYYVAVTRSGSTVTLYINGTSVATGTSSNSISQNSLSIGGISWVGSWSINGYLSNVRLSNTVRTITTPTTPYTSDANTLFLGAQSNRFFDNSSYVATATPTGSPSVQRFSPFSPTTAYSTSVIGGSGYFDGSGDYLQAPSNAAFSPSTGDFTIECWAYLTSVSGEGTLFYINATNGINLFLNISSNWGIARSGVAVDNNFGTPPSFNVWNHLAVSRSGSTIRAFINGAQVFSGSNSSNYAQGTANIGSSLGFGTVTGYISNFRFVNGTAVYTSAFTPPTAPLTAVSGTSLLVSATNAGILDNAMMNDLETVGNAQISTSVKKYGSASMYFPYGVATDLTMPSRPNLDLSTGNFTMEFWAYYNSFGTDRKYFLQVSGGSYWQLVHDTSFGISLRVTGYSAVVNQGSNAGWVAGAWYHVALVRNGSSFTIYRNGISIATGTSSSSLGFYSPTYIGGYDSTTAIDAYLDDFRITKGVARYTANFTPPTSAFPDL